MSQNLSCPRCHRRFASVQCQKPHCECGNKMEQGDFAVCEGCAVIAIFADGALRLPKRSEVQEAGDRIVQIGMTQAQVIHKIRQRVIYN